MSDINTQQITVAKEFNFRFKKDKLGNKRPNVVLNLPVPTVAGFVEILKAGGPEYALLEDAAYSVIKSVASEIVADRLDISQENFPVEQVFWRTIANMPKAERATISQEQWDGFASDYSTIMPGLTGKTPDQVAMAVQIYLKKFNMVKTNKPILSRLKEQLGLYIETPNAENYSDVLELLLRRVDMYLAMEEMVVTSDAI